MWLPQSVWGLKIYSVSGRGQLEILFICFVISELVSFLSVKQKEKTSCSCINNTTDLCAIYANYNQHCKLTCEFWTFSTLLWSFSHECILLYFNAILQSACYGKTPFKKTSLVTQSILIAYNVKIYTCRIFLKALSHSRNVTLIDLHQGYIAPLSISISLICLQSFISSPVQRRRTSRQPFSPLKGHCQVLFILILCLFFHLPLIFDMFL